MDIVPNEPTMEDDTVQNNQGQEASTSMTGNASLACGGMDKRQVLRFFHKQQ